jgi:hypothetical protein
VLAGVCKELQRPLQTPFLQSAELTVAVMVQGQ